MLYGFSHNARNETWWLWEGSTPLSHTHTGTQVHTQETFLACPPGLNHLYIPSVDLRYHWCIFAVSDVFVETAAFLCSSPRSCSVVTSYHPLFLRSLKWNPYILAVIVTDIFILLTVCVCVCVRWLCDCDVIALDTVLQVGAVFFHLPSVCIHWYKGPWEMQSGGLPPSSLCVWKLESVNMSLLIRITDGEREKHIHCLFPLQPITSFCFVLQTFTNTFPELLT